MFNDFPSLHPFAVHFPIVLILLAAAFQAVVTWKENWRQVQWVTYFIMGAAFFSALATSTVFHAEPSADAPKAAMEMFEQHERYAQLTLWLSGITLLLKSIGMFFKINQRLYEVIVLVAAIIAAVLLSIAGHHGARLTHIAGVGPMGRYLMKEHGMEGGDMKGMDGMEMKGDSAMNMDNKMPGMDTMNNMEGMKGMEDKQDMKNMGDMKGMEGKQNMKNMGGMKGMEGKQNMENMGDMDGMEGKQDMKNMGDMKGMEGKQDMKNMGDMKGMEDMKMPASAMDTLRFPDNNPARKKSRKPHKQ